MTLKTRWYLQPAVQTPCQRALSERTQGAVDPPAGLMTELKLALRKRPHQPFAVLKEPRTGEGGRWQVQRRQARRDFGSVDAFKKQMNTTTAGIQGSGWRWLGYNPKTKKLEIMTTPNQDPLLSAC
jgi:Iron/manganese superoxide dismutases, C-terminal domain